MDNKIQAIQEIYRRGEQGRLNPRQKQVAEELIKRGVVKVSQVQAQTPSQIPLSEVQRPETTQLETAGRYGLRGATFGFSEKLIPYISAAAAKIGGGRSMEDIPYQELVTEARKMQQAEMEKGKEEFPKTALASEIAGGIASPVGAVGTRAARATGGGLIGTMAGAATEGAIAGAGYTEDITDVPQVAKDVTTSSLLGAGLGGTLYGIGKGIKAVTPTLSAATQRLRPKAAKSSEIRRVLEKEGLDSADALRRMNEEGLVLSDVIDQRSALISSLPEKSYEKATIDTIDRYVDRLNLGTNKAKDKVLNMISKNVISADEGAEILGKNAKDVVDIQRRIRTEKAKKLYEKAFDSKNVNNIISETDEILQVPAVQDAIGRVKQESIKFGDKTISNVDKLPDNSLPVLHQAKDYLYRKSKDITDLESARYRDLYNRLSSKLKAASKDYKEATKVWAGETEGLDMLMKQKGIGNIAKKYEQGNLDGIKSSLKNIFKPTVSDSEVSRLKEMLSPEDFNSILRKDLDVLIDEAGDRGSKLVDNLFGKAKDRSLKSKRLDMMFTPNQKQGLRKMAERIDLAKSREDLASKVRFGEGKTRVAQLSGGKYDIINNVIKMFNGLVESPEARRNYVELLTTDQGKKILENMAKSKPSDIDQGIISIIRPLLVTKQGMEENGTGI